MRQDLQSFLFNRISADLADAICPGLDATERLVNLVNDILLTTYEFQGKLAIEIVRPLFALTLYLLTVQIVTGQKGNFINHTIAQIEKELLELAKLLCREMFVPSPSRFCLSS